MGNYKNAKTADFFTKKVLHERKKVYIRVLTIS